MWLPESHPRRCSQQLGMVFKLPQVTRMCSKVREALVWLITSTSRCLNRANSRNLTTSVNNLVHLWTLSSLKNRTIFLGGNHPRVPAWLLDHSHWSVVTVETLAREGYVEVWKSGLFSAHTMCLASVLLDVPVLSGWNYYCFLETVFSTPLYPEEHCSVRMN